MNIFSLFSRKANQDGSVRTSIDLLKLLGVYGSTKSGQSVSATTAIEVATVLACLLKISNGVAQVPFKLFQQKPGTRDRLPAIDHPLYPLLHSRPNGWMTSFELRELIIFSVILCGYFVAFVNRGIGGRVMEIIPFKAGDVEVKQNDDYTLSYVVTGKNGNRQTFPQEAVWHIRGPSLDGVVGLPIIKLIRETIGLAMATEESHSKMHKNGAMIPGTYSIEGTLQEGAYKKLRDWIDKEYGGAENAGKIMILDRSAKFLPRAMTGLDSQHLETRKHQAREVCSGMGVMPFMVGIEDKTMTFASSEQILIMHVVHTLMPWYTRIEQTVDAQLLMEKDRLNGVYSKLIAAGLLRGAMKDTAEYLAKLVQTSIMSPNEARELLELNPMEGGDERLVAVNLTTNPNGAPAATGATP